MALPGNKPCSTVVVD